VHAVAHTGACPARAGPAAPHGLIAPCAGALQELAKQADPNLTLDTEAQQAREHPCFRATCVSATLTRAHPAGASAQVLQDIAEDFVENVAAFACELVKRRALSP
jgi:transcription initiation factor TFIID subunit TAF12